MKKDSTQTGATLCSSMRPRSATTSWLNKFKLLAFAFMALLSINAWADTKTDIMFAKGFGGYTTSSFSAAGTDYSAVANSTNATGVTYAMQVFNGSTGAVRGNQSTATNNFNCRNTTTKDGYYISQVQLTVSNGTIDGSTNNRSVVYFGSSKFTTSPSGTATSPSPASSGQATLTWTNTDQTVSYFILYNLKTSGTALSAASTTALKVTWTQKSASKKTVYLSPSDNWKEASAKFAVYSITTSSFLGFMSQNCDGKYYYELPAGTAKIIFTRNDPTSSTPSFAWGQTADLDVPSDKNMYTVVGWATSGSWSTYTEPKYSVTCHLNGGDGSDVVVSNKACGDKVNLASTPTRTGWTFLGWYDGSGNRHDAGEEVTVSGNMEYWAHWGAYVLHGNFTGSWTDNHFYVNNDDYADINLAAGNYEFGIAYRETDKSDVWKGQTGSSSMTRGNSTWTLNGSNNVKITADVAGTYRFAYNTSTASMTVTYPALPVTVTFKNNGVQTSTQQVPSGGTIGTLPTLAASQAPISGYTFIGWVNHNDVWSGFEANLTQTLITGNEIINADVTYDAVWAKVTNNFEVVREAAGLTAGNYVIDGYDDDNDTEEAMDNTFNGKTFPAEEHGVISTTDNSIIWNVTIKNGQYALKNLSTNTYFNFTGSSSLTLSSTPVYLTISGEVVDELYEVDLNNSSKHLEYDNNVFDSWSSAYNTIYFYKQKVNNYFVTPPAQITVTWHIGTGTQTTTSYDGTAFSDVDAPSVADDAIGDCVNKFMGWATTTITKDEATAEDVAWADETTISNSNKDFYAVFAQAEGGEETTLVNFTGGTSSDLTGLNYVSANGLGTDYAASNAPYQVKLDNTGDYILLSLPSVPTNISIAVKMLGGATASSITLKESATADGTFTDVETMSISGSQNDVVAWTSTETFTQKYIKLYFTKGSNVGLGGLQVQAGGTSYSNYATSCPDLKYATITFDANGKTLASGSMPADITTAVVGRACALPSCSATVTGYTFAGWSATQSGEVITEYTPTIEGQTYTMYAKWTAKTVTITWDANGGSVDPTSSSYTYDDATVELPTPTNSDASKKFVGWFTAATGGTQITEIGTTNKPAANVTYFAQWRDITWTDYLTDCGTSYNITLFGGGTKTGGNTFSTSPDGSAIGGSTVTLTANPNSCYTFTSWSVYKTGDQSTTVTVDGNSFEMPEYDVTVDATFTQIDYVISYDLQGGGAPQGSEETYGNVNVGCGNTWTAPVAPVKAGHDFAGWYNGATLVNTGYEPTGNCTLTAHWTAQTYTITYFDRNGAAFSGTNLASLPTTHTYGEDTSIPDATVDDDHVFQGWWWDDACTTTPFTGGILTGTAVTTNVILYAKILEKACDNQYSFHWGGSDVKTNNSFACFTWIEDTKHEIADYVIENAADVHKYFVGYNGYFFDDNLGTANAKSYVNDVKYIPFEATMANDARPTIGSNATGAIGTLRIYHDSGWDNLYLTFRPNGYGLMYGATGTENKIAFTQTSATVWQTAPVELTADMKKTDDTFKYQVGLLKSDDDYTACGHGEVANFGSMGSYCSTWGNGGWGGNLSEYAAGRWGYFEIWIDNVAKNWCCHFTPMYRLHYDLDGGENANIHDEFRSYAQSGADLNTTVTTEVPVRDGYTFLGWKKGETPIAAGATVAINADNVVITAQWAENFTVTYDLAGYSTSCSSSTVHYCDEEVTVCPAPDNKTGYTFKGWNTDDITGSAADFAPGYEFIMPCNDVVFTAHYQADEYTITYLDEGGAAFSGTHGTDHPTTHTYGTATTLVNPTKTGYNFGGWYLDDACAGTQITILAADGYTANITLYAKWTIQTYTVTFDLNGGQGPVPPALTAVPYNSTISAPDAPADYEDGSGLHTFAGWYKENTCANAWNFTSDVVTGNTTLYAKWSGVTYEDYRTHCCTPLPAPEGGAASNIHMTTATLSWDAVTNNNGYQVSADQTNWTNVSSGTTSYGLTGLTAGTHYIYYVRAIGDDNVYCQYGTTAQIEFTTKAALHITYNANGGTGADVESDDIEEGASATVAGNTFTAPTGMTFNGWNTATDGTGTAYAVGATINPLNENLTLYAQWKGETYNITYNLNGGAWNGTAGAATYEFGTGIPTLATNVEKSGFRFDGWYDNSGLTGSAVTSIGTTETGNKEFWAKWTAVYAITYTIPGGTLATDAQTSAASGETFEMPGLEEDGNRVPEPYDCETLIGWTTISSFKSETGAMPDPFYAVGATSPVISGATTFYAVYSRAGQGASGTISLTNDEIKANFYHNDDSGNYGTENSYTNSAGIWKTNGYTKNNGFIQLDANAAYYFQIPTQAGNLTSITITHNSNSSDCTLSIKTATTGDVVGTKTVEDHTTETTWDVSDLNIKTAFIYCTSYTFQIQSISGSYGAPNIISTGLNCSNDILEFTVTYDANSGQFPGATTACTSPEKHTFNGEDPETNKYTICDAATCEGMTLIGWNSQMDGQGGLNYTPGQVISSVSQDEFTLYAQFAFNVNVKDNDDFQEDVHPSERGGAIDLDGGNDVCDPAKYDFIGWTTDNPTTWKQTITKPFIFSSDKVTTYTPTAAGTQVTAVYGMSTSVGSQAFYISYNDGSTVHYLKFNGENRSQTTVEAEATAMYRENINSAENKYHLYYMNNGVKTYFYYNNSDLAVSTSNPGQSYGWVITTDGSGVSTFQSIIAPTRYLSYSSSFTTHTEGYKRPLTITTGAKEYKYYDETTCTDEITITFNAGGGTMDPVTTQVVGHEGDVITVPECSYPGWTWIGWVTTPVEAQTDIKIVDAQIYTNEDGHEYEIPSHNETLYAYYTKTPEPPTFDGNISDVWKIYVPTVVGAEYVYHYEVGAKNITSATAHGEYATTTRCIEATDWAFTNVGTNQFTIQNPKGLYLNGDPNGDENDIYFSTSPSVWTMEAKSNGFYKFVNENTPDRYLAFQINNSDPTFVNTSTHNETNPAYSYVKVGGCTDPVYTTKPGGEFTLNMLGNVRVTSTNGKTVRSVDALSISADNLTPNTAITLSADPAVLTFCDATGAALSLTTDANGKLANTAVYVKYTPTAYNTTETPTITATCGEQHQDFAGLVTGRSLPEKFIIAQKVGDDWYALPNDMTNSQTNPAAVKLLSVDEAAGTATIYSDVENYLAWTMDVTGQEEHKNTLEFADAIGTKYLKVAETDANTIGQYTKQTGAKQNYTEFLPATTDLVDYTLYNNAQTKYIGISSDVWGVYSDAATVRFLVIDQQPAVNLTLSGDVVLTSANGIEVYGNQTSNLLHISANYTNVAKLRYTYNDGTSDVTVSNSVFRLNYYGFPDKTDYTKADVTAGTPINVSSLTGEVDQTFSVSLKPTAANTTYNYTLTIAALDASNNVMEEKQITLKGRSLPEQFVIAMKNTTDNKWYALPNDLATSTSGSSSTKAPLLISVDNTTTPTKALMAPKNTLYKGDSRYQPNSHRNAIRFLRADAESNAWITTSSTSLLYMPNNGADKQQFNLLSSDLSAYTITQDDDTKTIAMYGGTIGWYSSSNNTVYLLPVEASAEEAVFDVVEWFPTKLLIESSQAIETTSVQVGDAEAIEAAASTATYGTNLYEVQTGNLTAKAGQAMSVSYEIDATLYAKVVTVPIILSQGTYATATAENLGGLVPSKYQENDLVVRDGATLTVDAATGTHNTFKNVTIYPTSKVVVPAKASDDATKEVTMTTATMTLFGGTDEIYNGAYTMTKYGVPQLVLNGKLVHSETTSGLVYDVRVDKAQYYNFALPYTSKYELVTDNKGGEDFTFWTKIYNGQTRLETGNGWVWYDWDADPWAINIGTGYMFAAQPYSGQNYIIIRHPMGYYNAGEDKYAKNEGGHQSGTAEATKAAVSVTAPGMVEGEIMPGKTANNVGWNFIANPFMANFQLDQDGETAGTIQVGQLVEHKEGGKWNGKYDWDAGGSKNVRYVTLYDNGSDTYTQLPMSTAVLAPFTGFFVQIAKEGTIVFDIAGRANEAPARMLSEDELPSEMEIFLHATCQSQKDDAVLFINDDLRRDNAKEFPNEMTKQENANTLNFYTFGGDDVKMYANGMSYEDAQGWSKAGVKVAAAGEYTFSVASDKEEYIQQVILKDMDSNTEYDLMNNDAKIYLDKGEMNDRFFVKIVFGKHNIGTGITERYDVSAPEKFILNDHMYIRANGVLFDGVGKRVK